MLKLYDFRCTEGHIEEHLCTSEEKQRRCSCGSSSTRIISPTKFILNGADDGWPTAHSKWVREHERAGSK